MECRFKAEFGFGGNRPLCFLPRVCTPTAGSVCGNKETG